MPIQRSFQRALLVSFFTLVSLQPAASYHSSFATHLPALPPVPPVDTPDGPLAGGPGRGGECSPAASPTLAFLPATYEVSGPATPLWFHAPYAPEETYVRFVLKNKNDERLDVLDRNSTALSAASSATPGFIRLQLQLPDERSPKAARMYSWTFSIYCNADDSHLATLTGDFIVGDKTAEPLPDLQSYFDRVDEYVADEKWARATALLAELRCYNPERMEVEQKWHELFDRLRRFEDERKGKEPVVPVAALESEPIPVCNRHDVSQSIANRNPFALSSAPQ